MTAMNRIFLFVGSLLLTNGLHAQQAITLQAQRCNFQLGTSLTKLYVFELSGNWAHKGDRLLTAAQATGKVKILASNVPTVSAVTTTSGIRYVLINPDFLDSLDNPSLATGMMAHALAHQLASHTFIAESKAEEEEEADAFAGHLLCKLGFSLADMELVAGRTMLAIPIPFHEREEALRRGWKRCNAALNGAPGLSFYNNGEKEVELSFPHFPWPPPDWSCRHEIPAKAFAGCKKFADVDQKICNALRAGGYTQPAYFQVPGGFAIVTQLEQYNPDGSPKSAPARWDAQKVRHESFTMLDYLKALIYPTPGLFRVSAFILTPKPFHASGQQIPKEEAMDWLQQGFNKLPLALQNQAWTTSVNVTVLVYEFTVADSDKKVSLNRPGRLTGEVHLLKSNILNTLLK